MDESRLAVGSGSRRPNLPRQEESMPGRHHILRRRRAKIVATLGPSTSTPAMIEAILKGGADVFRLNFSHGDHADHAERLAIIRSLERKTGRPIGVLADVQGPKLRIGRFSNGHVILQKGQAFRLDLSPIPGDVSRVQLPHPEIIGAATPGMNLLIDDGKLTSWLLDCASARQLGLATTGHAARGTGGPPSPSITNLYLAAGKASVQELIGDIKQGFYVTELMGMGVNGVTGDYSRGAAGFWIENGEIAFPVAEVTIAGNLIDMYARLTPASDLAFRHGTNAPTVRIDGMTLAGA